MTLHIVHSRRLAASLLVVGLAFSWSAGKTVADNKKPGGGSSNASRISGQFQHQNHQNSSGNGNGVTRTLPIQTFKPIVNNNNGNSNNNNHHTPKFDLHQGFPSKIGIGNNQGSNTGIVGKGLNNSNKPNQGNNSNNGNSHHNQQVQHNFQPKIHKLPIVIDPGKGNGNGPIKTQPHHDNHDCHKDIHGHLYQHFCQYQNNFYGWWYPTNSYSRVVVIPTVVGLPGNVLDERPILISNLPENGSAVSYLVGDQVYRTDPGEVQPIRAGSTVIDYDRGGGLGPVQYALTPGTYEFRQTNLGWQLVRKTFRVTIENRGAIGIFRFRADGELVELPAGEATRLETAFPPTIVFDQNGETVTRQLGDGTFVIAPSPESGKPDLVAAEGL